MYREHDGVPGLSLRYGSTLSSVKWTPISPSPVATRTRARTNAQCPLLDLTMTALISLGIYLELAVCYCIYPCM